MVGLCFNLFSKKGLLLHKNDELVMMIIIMATIIYFENLEIMRGLKMQNCKHSLKFALYGLKLLLINYNLLIIFCVLGTSISWSLHRPII